MAQQAPVAFINELHRDARPDQFTEIIVRQDNLDLRGYYLGDNNGATNSWQPKMQFTQNALWQHLRAGTYIVISNARSSADCRSFGEDLDASDGSLRVCINNSTYFRGGSDATSMDFSGTGDFVQLVTPSGQMVHALGYDDNAGTSVEGGTCYNGGNSYTNDNNAVAARRPCGKFIFLRQTLTDGQSVGFLDSSLTTLATTPGTFSDGSPTLINTVTASDNHGNNARNIDLMRRLRQPGWPMPTGTCTQPIFEGVRVTFIPINDPYLADNTLRYLVIRYPAPPAPLEATPQDGIEYAVGSTLGSGTVAALLPGSTNGTFDDMTTVPNSHYRIYALRYTLTGSTSLGPDRGPAYNETYYSTAAPGAPLTLTGPSTLCPGDTAMFTADYSGPNTLTFTSPTPGLTIVASGAVAKVTLAGSVAQGTAFTLTATLPGGGACASPGTATFTVSSPTLRVYGDSLVDYGTPANVYAVASAPVTVTPDGLEPIDNILDSLSYIYRDSVTRTFTFTIGQGACGKAVQWTVRVKPSPVNLFIPNVVAKSGLPANQTFTIKGAAVSRLSIYNRWGAEVLDAIDYTGDWNALPGLYFYMADLTLPNGDSHQAKGWVEVVD